MKVFPVTPCRILDKSVVTIWSEDWNTIAKFLLVIHQRILDWSVNMKNLYLLWTSSKSLFPGECPKSTRMNFVFAGGLDVKCWRAWAGICARN